MHDRKTFLCLLVLVLTACRGGGGGSGSGDGSFATGSPPGDTGEVVESLLNNPLSSLCRTYGGNLYFGSQEGKLLTVSSNGSGLTVLDGNAMSIHAAFCEQTSTTDQVWFAGDGGSILALSGTTLNSVNSGITETLRDLFGPNSSSLYAVGNMGTILHFQDNNRNEQDSGVIEHLRGIDGPGDVLRAHLTVVGDHCTILQTLNAGNTWSPVGESICLGLEVPLNTHLNDVYQDATGEIFIVGNSGKILNHSGGQWTLQAQGATDSDLLSVHGVSSTSVIAVGDQGAVLHYIGSGWVLVDSPAADLDVKLTAVKVFSPTFAMAVGVRTEESATGGFVMTWDGATWNQVM